MIAKFNAIILIEKNGRDTTGTQLNKNKIIDSSNDANLLGVTIDNE